MNRSKAKAKRDNFYRISSVILDDAKDVFIGLLNFHLKQEKLTLTEFVEKHRHQLYHFFFESPCCMCPKRPRLKRSFLHEDNFDKFFDKNGHKDATHQGCCTAKHCCSPVKHQIIIDDFDVTLLRVLLVNFTSLIPYGSGPRQAVEAVMGVRNRHFGHGIQGSMTDDEFDENFTKLSNSLVQLSKISGEERQVKKALSKAKTRPLDETNYQNILEELKSVVERALEGGFENLQQKKRRSTDDSKSSAKRIRLSHEHSVDEESTSENDDDNAENITTNKSEVEPRQLRSNDVDQNTTSKQELQVRVVGLGLSPFIKDKTKHILRLELFDGKRKIYGSAFGQLAIKLHTLIEKEQCYKISGYRWTKPQRPGADDEMRLVGNTTISKIRQNSIPQYIEIRKSIKDVINNYKRPVNISLTSVVVTAIGPPMQFRNNKRREIILRDHSDLSGKIKAVVWENSKYYMFPFTQGDVVEVLNSEIKKFCAKINPEFFITLTSTTDIIKCTATKISERMLNDDTQEVTPIETSLLNVNTFRGKKNSIVIVKSGSIIRFSAHGKVGDMVLRKCNIETLHGPLNKKPNGKYYCEECCSFRTGDLMAQLDAEISDQSGCQTWVKMYDQASKEVLGENYDVFIDKDYDHHEKCQILRKIANESTKFTFELSSSCNYEAIIVKNVTRL